MVISVGSVRAMAGRLVTFVSLWRKKEEGESYSGESRGRRKRRKLLAGAKRPPATRRKPGRGPYYPARDALLTPCCACGSSENTACKTAKDAGLQTHYGRRAFWAFAGSCAAVLFCCAIHCAPGGTGLSCAEENWHVCTPLPHTLMLHTKHGQAPEKDGHQWRHRNVDI
jgi:hypothetical protein